MTDRGNNVYKFDVEVEGEKAGYLTVKAWPGQKELVVKQIQVDEKFRRRGLASRLHDEAFKFAQKQGLEYRSDASLMRTPAAEAFWKKMIKQGRAREESGIYTMISGLNEWTENVFCPTGKGGGIDPTCPAGGRKAAIDRLAGGMKKANAGEFDPLGQRAAGPPAGMDKGAPRIIESVQKYYAERSIGKPLDKIYDDVKGETGWTKEEFNRALIALHRDKIQLSGWAKTIDEIPDPEIAPMISEMIMGYAKPL